MRKCDLAQTPTRVLARLLATEELIRVPGGGPDTTWTDGNPRHDLTQISAGDTPGSPPPPEI